MNTLTSSWSDFHPCLEEGKEYWICLVNLGKTNLSANCKPFPATLVKNCLEDCPEPQWKIEWDFSKAPGKYKSRRDFKFVWWYDGYISETYEEAVEVYNLALEDACKGIDELNKKRYNIDELKKTILKNKIIK